MKNQMFIGVLALMASVSVWAQGTTQFTVIPYGLATQSGDDVDALLFAGPEVRQQVWRGTYLGQQWTQPVLITEISFRLNEGTPSTATVIPRVELRLASTQRTPENLTLFWEVNAGADRRVVFLQENYSFVASGGASPNPWDVRFEMIEPFYYDPQAGNLLMYVETWSPTGESFEGGRPIDAHGIAEAGMIGGPVTNPIHLSVVTQFRWQAIPEPTISSFFLVAAVIFLASRKNVKVCHS